MALSSLSSLSQLLLAPLQGWAKFYQTSNSLKLLRLSQWSLQLLVYHLLPHLGSPPGGQFWFSFLFWYSFLGQADTMHNCWKVPSSWISSNHSYFFNVLCVFLPFSMFYPQFYHRHNQSLSSSPISSSLCEKWRTIAARAGETRHQVRHLDVEAGSSSLCLLMRGSTSQST